MDEGGALGVAVSAQAGQKSGDTGTDVLAKEHKDRVIQSHHTAQGQRLKDTDAGRGALDHRGEERAGQNAQDGIGEGSEEIDKGLIVPQRSHGGAHQLHAQEEDAQTGNDLADAVDLLLLEHGDEHHAEEGQQRRDEAHVQRNEKAGHGGTHVGTHDHANRLLKGHQAGVDESHHHDSGRRGALNDCRNTGAHQDAQDPLGSEHFQNGLQAVTCRDFQTRAHNVHAVQKQGKSAEEHKNVFQLHFIFSFVHGLRRAIHRFFTLQTIL